MGKKAIAEFSRPLRSPFDFGYELRCGEPQRTHRNLAKRYKNREVRFARQGTATALVFIWRSICRDIA